VLLIDFLIVLYCIYLSLRQAYVSSQHPENIHFLDGSNDDYFAMIEHSRYGSLVCLRTASKLTYMHTIAFGFIPFIDHATVSVQTLTSHILPTNSISIRAPGFHDISLACTMLAHTDRSLDNIGRFEMHTILNVGN
jgi:hypothetical protein